MQRNWKKTNHCSSDLAPRRGLPSQCLTTLLVRSYRTFAPLPGILKQYLIYTGGIFLWHYPHDRSHWALSSKLGILGARTFLRPQILSPQLPLLLFPYLVYCIKIITSWKYLSQIFKYFFLDHLL